MPGSKQGRRIFDNFSGGDYGVTGGYKPAANTFRAENMLVTADGGIVPRPGLKDRTPASMPTGKLVALTPTVVPGREVLFIVEDTVYTYNIVTGAAPTSIGVLDVTPTKALFPKKGTTEFYITVPGDKCYKLDPVTNTIDPYDTSPGGTEIELFGQRMMVSGADEVFRVQFSDPGDFDSWPAENFFDVGDFWDITSMREAGNYLVIAKPRGFYLLSGVPGTSNAVLRRRNRERGPLHPGQLELDQNETMHFISAFRQNPATFDTVNVRQNATLTEFTSQRDTDASLPLVYGTAESAGDLSHSTVLVAQGGDSNQFLLWHNGVWTRHTTSVQISGMVRGGETGDFYLTDGGDDAAAPAIYSVEFTQDHPGFASDGFVQPGDDSTTPVDAWVTVPEIWSESGEVLAVRGVTVTYEKYNTGASGTNHFDIEVDMLGRVPAGTNDASTETQSWDEAQSSAGGAEGASRMDRVYKGFKTSRASGARVSLTNVRGVKIQSIEVVWDVFPQTGTQG